jgi:hypothetical protein
MKTITGKILSIEIGVAVNKRDGGTYQGWRLVYRNSEGKTEEIAKPMAGLKYQPALGEALKKLAAGDEFTAEMEKNASNYWEVISVRKGSEMPSEAAGTTVQPAAKKEYKTDKSGNWETTEERAARQVMIVRQSSLGHSVALFTGCHKEGDRITSKDVLKMAETFEAWVLRKPAEDAGEVE